MNTPQVFDFYKGKELIASGTIKEISEQTKIPQGTVYGYRYKKGVHELVLKGQYYTIYEIYNLQGAIYRGTKRACGENMNVSEASISRMEKMTREGILTGGRGGFMVRKIGIEFMKEGA